MVIIIFRFQGKFFFCPVSLSLFFLSRSLSFGFLCFVSPMLHNEITLEYFYKSYYYWIILKKIQNEYSLLTNYYDFRALILFLIGTSWKAKKIILFCTVIALKDQCGLIWKRCLEILYEFFTCGKILWGMNFSNRDK